MLWDIDRTLVDVGGVSRRIYEAAFRRVTGGALRELAEMTGRTERAILIDTCALHGIAERDVPFEEFYTALAEAAHELRGEIAAHGRMLPGADTALKAFRAKHVVQSVVTGNIRAIAVTKLEALGLADGIDFEIGGYGSDDGARAPLIRAAWRRANEKYRVAFDADRVVVIGDTPRDVEGARLAGVRSIAVATGSCTLDELRAAGPDAVRPDLNDVDGLVAAMLEPVA